MNDYTFTIHIPRVLFEKALKATDPGCPCSTYEERIWRENAAMWALRNHPGQVGVEE